MRKGRISLVAAAVSAGAFLVSLGNPDTGVADSTKITGRIQSRIELGRRLFYEPALSRSGQRSCASCHAPEHGFSDPDIVSHDDQGTTRRHSQTIVDSKWNPSAHWDGEFASVEELVTRRLGNRTSVWQRGRATTPPPRGPVTPRASIGTAVRSTRVAQKTTTTGPQLQPFRDEFPLARGFNTPITFNLANERRYEEGFRSAFGSKDVSLERIALAISAYCYSVESTEAPFDRYRAGDKKAISRSAKRGMLIFMGRGGCADCHKMDGTKPLFTDFDFHNTGVTYQAIYENRRAALASDPFRQADLRVEVTPADGEAAAFDRGRGRLTQRDHHERGFKTPTLRDVASRAPYMHNGAHDSLEDVVRWYAAGCGTDPDKDGLLTGFACSEQDVRDLVAFLESLSGDERPGLAKTRWKSRAASTKLTIMQGKVPLRDVDVKLVPVGDPIPARLKAGEDPDGSIVLRTNSAGVIRFKPRGRTHMRVVLPDDIPTINSPLIPDTCRAATIQTAIKGEMQVVVTFPSEWPAPPMIVAQHPSAVNAAGRLAPRTVFRRTGTIDTKDGRVARYSAWVRSDAPPSAVLRFPGLTRSRRGGGKLAAMNLVIEPGVERRLDLTAN
ncbi:MAG: cytochrome c peroxidase [Planctomycetota bacterium]|nr:cytochrome c peroxidase [Planctomycetota bacterium]